MKRLGLFVNRFLRSSVTSTVCKCNSSTLFSHWHAWLPWHLVQANWLFSFKVQKNKNMSSVKVMPGYLLFTEFMESIISALSVTIFVLPAACQGHGCRHFQLLFKCLTLPWAHSKTYWIKSEWLTIRHACTAGKSYSNQSDCKLSEVILNKAYDRVWAL